MESCWLLLHMFSRSMIRCAIKHESLPSQAARCVIGLVLLLGIAELEKSMGPKYSSVLRVTLGIVLMLTGLSLSNSSLGKAWGLLLLPLALVSTVLMTIGLMCCR